MSLCALSLVEAAADIRDGRLHVGRAGRRLPQAHRRGRPRHRGLGLPRPRPRACGRPRPPTIIAGRARPIGPLHGVPIGIKDIFDTGDMPTEFGSPLWAGRTPRRDAAAVARLRAAGAVIIGKTVTTEYAYFHPGQDPQPARTASTRRAAPRAARPRPWLPRMVPGAIGSQTNGSVIRPAAFCGVVGFKPTHGLIPRSGALLLSRALDHVGVFARSVEDAALLAETLAGFDEEDPDTRADRAPAARRGGRERAAVAAALRLRALAGLEAGRAGDRRGLRRAGRGAGRGGDARSSSAQSFERAIDMHRIDHGGRDGAQSPPRLREGRRHAERRCCAR